MLPGDDLNELTDKELKTELKKQQEIIDNIEKNRKDYEGNGGGYGQHYLVELDHEYEILKEIKDNIKRKTKSKKK